MSLLRYPSLIKESEAVEATGHRLDYVKLYYLNIITDSSHVTCTKWSNKDDFLYSSGGEDNCIF